MADPCGYGAALDDDEQARQAAVGEAVERYCGNVVPGSLPRATFTALAAAGQDAVDPETVALHSARQYAQPGFPFVPLSRDLKLEWVPGRDLRTGRETLVPATLVYLNYRPPGAPVTNLQIYAGIAAGESAEQAQLRALEELFERDAMTLTWTSGAAGHRLDPPDWLARLARGPTGMLRTLFCGFPNEVGLPVVGALMLDQHDGYLTFGTACRPDPLDAMCKAVAEAAHIQVVMRELDDPASAIAELGDLPASPLAP